MTTDPMIIAWRAFCYRRPQIDLSQFMNCDNPEWEREARYLAAIENYMHTVMTMPANKTTTFH